VIKFAGRWGEKTGPCAGFFVSKERIFVRTAFFVDGYNLFYGLLAGTEFKWLDLPGLLTDLARKNEPDSETVSVSYFTSGVKPALATRGIDSATAQNTYLRVLKEKGVVVVMGRHRLERGCAPLWVDGQNPSRTNRVDIWDLEEKETDVNIAISMYRLASKQRDIPEHQRIQQIVLVSADTDMTPALCALKEDFPEIRRGVIFPHREGIKRNPPGSLINESDWQQRVVSLSALRDHQLPNRVPTRKKPADKPHYW
jgi:uncharacterized LabA/DUF88 family protein